MKNKQDGLFFEPIFMDAAETAKFWEEMEGDVTRIYKGLGKLEGPTFPSMTLPRPPGSLTVFID